MGVLSKLKEINGTNTSQQQTLSTGSASSSSRGSGILTNILWANNYDEQKKKYEDAQKHTINIYDEYNKLVNDYNNTYLSGMNSDNGNYLRALAERGYDTTPTGVLSTQQDIQKRADSMLKAIGSLDVDDYTKKLMTDTMTGISSGAAGNVSTINTTNDIKSGNKFISKVYDASKQGKIIPGYDEYGKAIVNLDREDESVLGRYLDMAEQNIGVDDASAYEYARNAWETAGLRYARAQQELDEAMGAGDDARYAAAKAELDRQSEIFRRADYLYDTTQQTSMVAKYAGMDASYNADIADPVYKFINGKDTAVNYKKYNYMTEDEKRTYNAIANSEGIVAANKYLDMIDPYINQRATDEKTQNAEYRTERLYTKLDKDERKTYREIKDKQGLEAATKYLENVGEERGWFGRTLASGATLAGTAVMAPLKAAAGLSDGLASVDWITQDAAGNSVIDVNDPLHRIGQVQRAIREESKENLNTGVGRFAYDVVASSLDSYVNSLVASGITNVLGYAPGTEAASNAVKTLTNVLMTSEAIGDSTVEAVQNGYSPNEAAAIGTMRGLFEAITETVSLEMIMGDPAEAAKKVLKDFAAEGSEEVASNFLNNIFDIIIGDENGIVGEYKRKVAEGVDKKQAFKEALLRLGTEDLMAFLAGGLSGAMMGETFSQMGYRGASKVASKAVNALDTQLNASNYRASQIDNIMRADPSLTYFQAESIYNQQNADAAVAATDNGLTSRNAQKAAEAAAAGKTISDKQAYSLSKEEASVRSENLKNGITNIRKAAIEARLNERGETGDVSKLADIIAREVGGRRVTAAEHQAVLDSHWGSSVLSEATDSNPKEWVAKMDAEVASYINKTSAIERGTYEKLNLDKAAENFGEQAEAFKRIYNMDAKDTDDVTDFYLAYEIVENAAMTDSQSLDSLLANPNVSYVMSPEQIKSAYAVGAGLKTETASGALGKAVAGLKTTANGTARHVGVVRTATGTAITNETLDSVFSIPQDSARSKAVHTAYRVLSRIAEVTGIDIVLTDNQTVNEKGQYVSEEGHYSATDSGTIYIDINSGLLSESDKADVGKYTMIRVFSHEFTHFLESWNAEAYVEFRKLVFDTMNRNLAARYSGSGRVTTVDDIINYRMNSHNKAIDAMNKADGGTREHVNYEGASREVVAEAMTEILPETEFIQDLYNNHKNLFDKLSEKLGEFVSNLNEAFNGGVTADKFEVALVTNNINGALKYAKDIVKAFNRMAKQGVENYQAAIAGQETDADIEDADITDVTTEPRPVENVTQNSVRSLAEAGGFKAVKDKNGTIYLSRNGAKVSKVTVDDIDNSPIGALVNYSLESKYIDEKTAHAEKKLFADLLTMAAKSNDLAMAMQFAGSAIFTAIKSNSDKQYNTTYDFPSICTKTQAVIDSMSEAMMKKKGGLSKKEIEYIYNEVFHDGNPVPCPECYVFSRWVGIGSLLDNMWTYQNRYAGMSASQVQKIYLEMEKSISEVAANNNLSFGKAKGKIAALCTKRYNELYDRVSKAENQGERPSDKDVEELAVLQSNMETVKSMTWIDTVFFKDSAHTKINPKRNVQADVLFNLNAGESFANDYPEAWAFRTTQGAGYGKAITPYAETVLGEGIIGTNSISKLAKDKKNGSLNNLFLMQSGNLDKNARATLARATQKMNNQAFIGGQRFQSTSDARFENAFDYLLAALEVQAMNGMVQVYTKVPGAVPSFAAWGFSTNQSLMPKGGGLNADGVPIDTAVGGMNPEVAKRNRRDFETQGTITIGVNDNHIRAMMNQVWRDFIIPYHASGGDASLIASFRRIQDDGNVNAVRSTDYTRTQSDKVLSDEVLRNYYHYTDEQIGLIHARRKARIDIFAMNINGKKKAKPDMDIVNGSKYLSDLYEKLSAGGEWAGVTEPKSIVEHQIFPNEYWDQSVTYEQSGKITQDYLNYCEELGILHRFSGMVPSNGTLVPVNGYDQNGNRVKLTDLAYNADGSVNNFFWKVLTDRRMYDNDGKYLPQRRVTLGTTQASDVENFATTGRYGTLAGRQYNAELSASTAKRVANDIVNGNISSNSDNAVQHAVRDYDGAYEFVFNGEISSKQFVDGMRKANDVSQYFPSGLKENFKKAITKKNVFTAPRVYRGMDQNELDSIVQNGFIASNGSYNFANQQGMTFFDEDAGYALSYATSFAPKEIAAKHYEQGVPSYVVEVINSPELNLAKNSVQESFSKGEVPQEYISRIFAVYADENGNNTVEDITDTMRLDLPNIGKAKDGMSHGLPMFVRDKTTGTVLYAVQGEDGWENGKFISEKDPSITFSYDNFTNGSFLDIAKKMLGVSGDANDLEEISLDAQTPASARGNKNTVPEDGTQFEVRDGFTEDYDKWVENGKPNSTTIEIGETPEKFSVIGIKPKPIYWDTSKLNTIQKTHPYMTDDVIKQASAMVTDPIIVLESKTQANRVVFFGEVFVKSPSGDNVPVMAIIELLPMAHGYYLDEYRVASSYAKESPETIPNLDVTQEFINSSKFLYIDPDIERTQNWLDHTRLQLPFASDQFGFIDKITLIPKDVKGNFVFGQENSEEPDWKKELRKLNLGVEKNAGTQSDNSQRSVRNTSGMTEEEIQNANSVISRLRQTAIGSRYLEDYVGLSPDRMRRVINDSVYKGKLDTTKNYIAWIDPTDFVYATTTRTETRQRISEEAGSLDMDRLRSEMQPIYLRVNMDTGEIVGHEGRHRLTALSNAGVRRVAVIITSDTAIDNAQPISLLKLKGQSFDGGERRGTGFYAHSMMPITERYADTVSDLFGNAKVSYSIRGSVLTERDILRTAAEAARGTDNVLGMEAASLVENLTSAEKDALRIYGNRLAKLDAAEQTRRGLLADRKALRNGREDSELSASEKEALQAIQNNLDTVNEQRCRINAQLLTAENTGSLRKLAEKARPVLASAAVEKERTAVQKYAERRDESEGRGKYTKKIAETSGKLYEWVVKNTDKEHVPEILREPVIGLLESIDASSKRKLNGGDPTKADKKFAQSITTLRQLVDGQQDTIDGDSASIDEVGAYLDLSGESRAFLHELVDVIAKASGETFTINSMNAAQLRSFSKFMDNLTAAIRQANRLLANARYQNLPAMGQAFMSHAAELGKAKNSANGALNKFAFWQNATPFYAFKRFGSAGESVFDGLTRGWEKFAMNARSVIQFVDDLYEEYGVSTKELNEWRNKALEFKLESGDTVRMTTAQIMELSQLLNRAQARQHIEAGGVRIGDISQKRGGDIQDVRHHHLTANDLSNIIKTLTDRQLDIAKRLRKYMGSVGETWGNEISMARFGYKFYTEGENYYTIRTDSNDRPMSDTDAQTNSMFRLLNLSASKPLNPKANNALIVGDIFDTFSDHMSDMAKLNGLGLPILDAIKWFNYTERSDNGDGTFDKNGTKSAMESAFGKYAGSYFRTLIKDINGVREGGDRGGDFASRMISNYKIAAVAANLRVALLQPTSYVRAMNVIRPKYLLSALNAFKTGTATKAYREALKYSGTAGWKDLGYYDTDIARSVRSQIEHDQNWADKVKEGSMILAEKGDSLTWGRLWIACKLQVKSSNPSLEGDALLEKTGDLFRETIYGTQVMDSTLTRSEIMRGTTKWTKLATAFMAEPTLSLNLLMDSASEFNLESRKIGAKGAWKLHKRKIIRAFISYICAAAASAVVESLADAMRDDDDYETYWQKVLQAFIGEDGFMSGNLGQDLTIVGKIPVVKDIISTLKGDKSSDMSIASVESLSNAYKIWKETYQLANGELEKPTSVTWNGKMTTYGKIYKTLQALSQLTGLPGANLTRDAIAIWNTTVGGANPDLKLKSYDPGTKNSVKYAYQDGTMSAKDASAELIANGDAEDENDVYWMLREWDTGETSRYGSLVDALHDKDASAIAETRNELTSHGYTVKDVQTKANSEIGIMYNSGEISETEALNMMQQYGGLDETGASKRMAQWKYASYDSDGSGSVSQDELSDAFERGNMPQEERDRIWKEFGFKTEYTEEVQEKAAARVELDKNAVIYNSANWEDGLKDDTLPDSDKDTLVTAYGGKWFAEPYTNLRTAGYTPSSAYDLLSRMDVDGNHSVKQAEAHDVLRNMSEEEAARIWDAFGWKKEYATYAAYHP